MQLTLTSCSPSIHLMATSPFGWMQVGHWTDTDARTGCTVVRFIGDVVASGEVRGGAPATREFALLEPTRMVEQIHAVVLSGGSAFGLATGDGVARSLRAQDIGFATAHGAVPIVVGMSLYDLGVGHAMRWPGTPEGNTALDAAAADFEIGAVGAGAGATAGKWRGAEAAYDTGLGFATVTKASTSEDDEGDLVVSALVACNAVGDIATKASQARREIAEGSFEWPETKSPLGQNTTIGLIATNATLTKTECQSVAQAGHDGLARAVFPAHGPSDGDALVAVAKPEVETDLATIRMLAASAVEQAIATLELSS